jgi:ADP-heptose:LPS heptosyltransferase
MPELNRGPRILITRLSALGDCILTLPLACALRNHFPQAVLVWAVEPLAAELIGRHRVVDALVVVPKGWLASPHAVVALAKRLRAWRFDWVFDPQSLTKSSALAWLSGAPRRVGFTRPHGRELAPWLNNIRIPRRASHVVDATLQLLAPLGIDRTTVRFDIPSEPGAESRLDQFLRDTHLCSGFAVINSSASWPSKQWLPERYGRVARYLGERHDLPCVVTWSGPRERALSERILETSGGHGILAPQTNLLELAGLLRRARLFLGSDTGPLHLAAAVGTPCIGLYGPTRADHSGPYGSPHVVVEVRSQQVPRRRRRLDDSAMRRIMVEEVCAVCDQLLSRHHRERTRRGQAA